MSRTLLIVGLILSIAVHAWLLSALSGMTVREVEPPFIVPAVQAQIAALLREAPQPPQPQEQEPQPQEQDPTQQEPPPPPEPDPEPEPASQAEPQPAPQAEPEPQPVPEPEAPRSELVKVFEPPKSSVMTPGDSPGDFEGSKAPELRIDWGSDEQARAILDAGGMVLAVLDSDGASPVISQQVVREETGWQRRSYQPAQTTLFSNRLRIVDRVPAFGDVRRQVGLRPGERLAVVVPLRVERVLESAQLEAAFNRNLTMAGIDNFAGRFTLDGGRLSFVITHVGAIAGSVSP